MKHNKFISIMLVCYLTLFFSLLASSMAAVSDSSSQDNSLTIQIAPLPEGEIGDKIGKQMGITQDKLEQLRDIFSVVINQQLQIWSKRRKLQFTLETLLRDASISDQQIQSIANKLCQLQQKELQLTLNGLFQAKKILTPQQYETMVRLLSLLYQQEQNITIKQSISRKGDTQLNNQKNYRNLTTPNFRINTEYPQTNSNTNSDNSNEVQNNTDSSMEDMLPPPFPEDSGGMPPLPPPGE